MPRPKPDSEQAKVKKQLRNQKYRENITAKERNKEHDKVYRRRKREQARLRQHEDPLAQLADMATQQEYLEGENEIVNARWVIESAGEEEEEPIDVAGTVQEDGDILENFGDDGGFGESDDGGFMDMPEYDWNDDFDNKVDLNGSQPGLCD